MAMRIRSEPTAAAAGPFTDETNALARCGRCWCMKREPEGKFQAGLALVLQVQRTAEAILWRSCAAFSESE